MDLLQDMLHDVREGHYRAVTTFMDKDHETREKMRVVTSREEEMAKEVERLTAALKEEEERHLKEVHRRKQELASLKEKLRKLKMDTSIALRYARKETGSRTEALTSTQLAVEDEIGNKILEVQAKAEEELTAHETVMRILKQGEGGEGARRGKAGGLSH